MHFSNYLFNAINGLAGKSHLLDQIMIFSSRVLPFIFMGLLLLIFIIGFVKRSKDARGIAIDTLVITIINLMISAIIGHIWYFPRPFVNNSHVNLLYTHVADSSFPSDHAIGTMSIGLGSYRFNRILGIIFILLSLLTGFSRVFVGQHYPLDVLGGYILVFIVTYLYRKFVRNKIQDIYFFIEGKIPGLKNFN